MYTHTCSGIFFSHKEEENCVILSVKWLKVEIIMMSEINQAQKDKYLMLSLMCKSRPKK
jgi:hypothetical protein